MSDPGTFSIGEPSSSRIFSVRPAGYPDITIRERAALRGHFTPRRSKTDGISPWRAGGKGKIFTFSQKSAISSMYFSGFSDHSPTGNSGSAQQTIFEMASSGVKSAEVPRRIHSTQAYINNLRKDSVKPSVPRFASIQRTTGDSKFLFRIPSFFSIKSQCKIGFSIQCKIILREAKIGPNFL